MKRRAFPALLLALLLLASCSATPVKTTVPLSSGSDLTAGTLETAETPETAETAEPDLNETVYAKADVSLAARPEGEETLAEAAKGESLTRLEYGENGWDRVRCGETEGWVAHTLLTLQPIPAAAMDLPITTYTTPPERAEDYPEGWLEAFNETILELQVQFPKGTYWNSMGGADGYGVTSIPCNHNVYGEAYCHTYHGVSDQGYPGVFTSTQCLAFASLLSDRVFGVDAPLVRFTDYDSLRIGDQARINGNSHTVFILDKTDEYVTVAECNATYNTCVINWGRQIPRSALGGFYLSRWER